MKDPASILGKINSLYRELFELELGTSTINCEDMMETIKADAVEAPAPVPLDYQVRHDQIMSQILQLTHEYIQMNSQKT